MKSEIEVATAEKKIHLAQSEAAKAEYKTQATAEQVAVAKKVLRSTEQALENVAAPTR